MRSPIRKITLFAFKIFIILSISSLLFAEGFPKKNDGDPAAKEAVINLKAYAAYKSGDYETARRMWEELAENGNVSAMINLANLFHQGQGVEKDDRKALRYIREAAQKDDYRAQYELGIHYERGQLVKRDLKKAEYWLRKSAENGNPDGQFAYGILLATAYGKGYEKASKAQKRDALIWLKKADANRHTEAEKYIRLLEKNE